jgi:hypothetical protein
MPKNGDRFHADLAARLAAEAKQRLGAEEASALQPFFASYYANVAQRDLVDIAPETCSPPRSPIGASPRSVPPARRWCAPTTRTRKPTAGKARAR